MRNVLAPVAIAASAASCSLIDLGPLTEGAGGSAGSTVSGTATSTTTVATTTTVTSSRAASSSAEATQSATTDATTTTDASSSGTGCGPSFCAGSVADFCFDFDDGTLPGSFFSFEYNAQGTADVAVTPTDPCSFALRSELLGIVDPVERAYLMQGRDFDLTAVTSSVDVALKTYVAVDATPDATNIGVMDWETGTTTCQIIMHYENPQLARFFLQSLPSGGNWTYATGAAVSLDTSMVGRWVPYELKIITDGVDFTFELSVDGKPKVTATAPAHACAPGPTNGVASLYFGAHYTASPQTTYYDDLVVDLE